MKRIAAGLVGLLALAAAGRAAEPGPRVVSAANGYSIALLEDPAPAAEAYQSLTMLLPPVEGMSPNVNVRISPFDGDMVEYITASKVDFEKLGLTLISESRRGAAVGIIEYAGPMYERDFRWYARAELSGGKVYLVTGTALASQWATVAARLKACVDSFRIDGVVSAPWLGAPRGTVEAAGETSGPTR